jgi:hypothetical protein
MLLWENFFILMVATTFWSIAFSATHIFTIFLHSEFLLMLVFLICLAVSIFLNLTTLLGLGYFILILSGLELALAVILLAL